MMSALNVRRKFSQTCSSRDRRFTAPNTHLPRQQDWVIGVGTLFAATLDIAAFLQIAQHALEHDLFLPISQQPRAKVAQVRIVKAGFTTGHFIRD